MRRLALLALAPLALGLGLPPSASAAGRQEDQTFMDPMYLSFGAGRSFDDFDQAPGLRFNRPPNATVRFGYELMKLVDTELDYEFGGRFDDGDAEQRVNIHTLTANVKVLPTRLFAPDFRIKPYAVGGFGWLRADSTAQGNDQVEDGWAVRGGLGIEIPIDFYISAYTEASYVYGHANLDDIDTIAYVSVGAGLVVRFDSDGY